MASNLQAKKTVFAAAAVATGAFLVLSVVYGAKHYEYALFHELVEVFSMVVAVSVFMVAWNARNILENHYFLWFGIIALFVALFLFVHFLILTTWQMGTAGERTNLILQLYVIVRFLLAVGFVLAPLFIARKLNVALTFTILSALSSLAFSSILVWHHFPAAFIEEPGAVTPFYTVSETITAGLFLLGAIFLLLNRKAFAKRVVIFLSIAILLLVFSESTLELHEVSVSALSLIGHYLRIVAFFLIYQAVVATGLARPYELLFREMKKSEASLEAERDFIAAILETAGSVVVVLDPAGRVVRFNKAAEELTGYSEAEVRGRSYEMFVPEEEMPGVRETFARLALGKFPMKHENLWLTRDGRRAFMTWSNTIMFDPQGRVQYIIATGTDITDRMKAEQKLRELNETLEERVRERTIVAERRTSELRHVMAQLAATERRERTRLARVLHDHLQQLLVAAKLNVSMMQAICKDQKIRDLAEQVNSLLSESIEESRSLSVELSPPALKEKGLDKVFTWLAGWFREKHKLDVIVYSDSLDPNVDVPLEQRTVLFEAAKELLFNIVKHANTPTATLSVATADSSVMVEICDEGRGFDMVEAAGGFGLFSVKERIELVGGTFTIDSKIDFGTTVTITLPLGVKESHYV